MNSNDLIKRLIDAGLSFTQMTQARAEEIAKDLQDAGQLRMDEVQSTVQELMDRGRENTENLVRIVQREVTKQLENLGVDMTDLQARVEELTSRFSAWTSGATGAGPRRGAAAGGAKRTARKSTAKTSGAKKTTAKKSAATKTAAKKTTAKKTTARKSAAKKTTAKKSAATKTTAKKTTARKSAARKSASR